MKIILGVWLLWASQALGWTLVGANISGWDTPTLTVHLDTRDCTVSEAVLVRLLDSAIATWNAVSTAGINLRREVVGSAVDVSSFLDGSVQQVPLLLCDTNFGPNQEVDPERVPAATRLSTTGGRLTYGGILLNAQVGTGAEISQLTEDELLVTIAHELGHVLGLGHTSNADALMYYSVANKTRPILTQDDMDGLMFLYARDEFSRNPFGFSCGAVHREGTPSPFHGAWIGLFLLVSLGLGRLMVLRPERPL